MSRRYKIGQGKTRQGKKKQIKKGTKLHEKTQ